MLDPTTTVVAQGKTSYLADAERVEGASMHSGHCARLLRRFGVEVQRFGYGLGK